jgi:hypothetical protein
MTLSDRIALAGVFVAVIAVGIPIVFELRRQRRRADSSFHYWLESFTECAHYCATTIGMGQVVGEDLRLTFKERLGRCLDALGENAEFIEGHLHVTKQEDKTRDTYRLFHLMTTELQRRACHPIDLNASLFFYFASAVIALLLDANDQRAEDIGILVQSEQRYRQDVAAAAEKGRDSAMADSQGNTLPWVFFHDAIRHILPTRIQQEIATRI